MYPTSPVRPCAGCNVGAAVCFFAKKTAPPPAPLPAAAAGAARLAASRRLPLPDASGSSASGQAGHWQAGDSESPPAAVMRHAVASGADQHCQTLL